MELHDKVSFVTGAGSGIGRATCWELSRLGYKIAAVDNDLNEVRELCESLSLSGDDCLPLAGDVSDSEQLSQAVEAVTQRWGRIDRVVANAGINGVWAPVDRIPLEDWKQILNINLTGTFLTIKHTAKWLKQHGGAIVIVSSVNGTRCFSNIGASAYATSKAGQLAFMKMIALELAQFRIRVNAVCPGAISTDINESTQQRDLDDVRPPMHFPWGGIPLTNGHPGTAEQVARLIAFLLSDEADHITGTEMWIDGASSLIQG